MDIVLPAPSEKQRQFMMDKHKHVAFGGARGGGKSFALKEKAILMALRYAGIRIAIVRRTYPELMANHIRPMKQMLHIGQQGNPIKYNDRDKMITFPNGSTVSFWYNATEADNDHFQGQEFDVLMLDECTLFSRSQLDAMRACIRGVNEYPKRIYYTCNPNGQSMGYIKRLFIDRAFEDNERPEEYSFIQSLLTDNEALMKANPDYVNQLKTLPPKLRRAWLEGDWTTYEGMYFEEMRTSPDLVKCEEAGITEEDARIEGRWTHVIEPFEIPHDWKIYRSYDWGYGKPFSVGWWAQDYDNVLYRILELYGCTETPNEGVHWTNKQQMQRIKEIEAEHPWLKGKRIEGVADPSIWDGSHDGDGVSCAEEADKLGIFFVKGNNERIAGWMQLRERMKFDANGKAMIYFFSNCKAIIRCMPLMMYDEHKPEDLDTRLEDHCLDEARYMCQMCAIPPRKIDTHIKPMSDPLNQFGADKGRFSKLDELRMKRG